MVAFHASDQILDDSRVCLVSSSQWLVFSEVVSLMHLDSLILCGLWVCCKVSERYHSHVSGMLDHLADEKYPGFPLEGHTCMCVEKERSIRALVRHQHL